VTTNGEPRAQKMLEPNTTADYDAPAWLMR
jgi:hypothetical protein